MVRAILTILLPIAAPTALYLIWLWFARRKALAEGKTEIPQLGDAPWIWLACGGIALAIGVMWSLPFLTGGPVDGIYVPPHVVDGEIVPGQILPPGSTAHPSETVQPVPSGNQ